MFYLRNTEAQRKSLLSSLQIISQNEPLSCLNVKLLSEPCPICNIPPKGKQCKWTWKTDISLTDAVNKGKTDSLSTLFL